MNKECTTAGFLYHAPTQQILLFQSDEDSSDLAIFQDKCEEEKDPKLSFHKLILSQLGIELETDSVFEIYKYLNKKTGVKTHLFYAEVSSLDLDFDLNGEGTVGWFPLKLVPKLSLPKQTKHDIVIGQRVIDHNERQKQEQITG